jgi:hypothetical protein
MTHYNASSSANLLGLNSIVNKDTVNKNINLKNAELEFLSDISSRSGCGNNYNNEIYNKNIKEIADEIGIDIDNISLLLENNKSNKNDKDDDRRHGSDINNNDDRIHDSDRYDDNGSKCDRDKHNKRDDMSDRMSNVKNDVKLVNTYDAINREILHENDNNSNVSRRSDNMRNDFPSLQQRFNIRADTKESKNDIVKISRNEQYRHDVFSNVLNNIKPNADYTHDIYTEELKNKKSMVLEQIQLLKLLLQEENEDITNIPDVSELDTIERLDHVYKILKIKKDRNQFSTLGEEIIMFGVHLLESFFDGERVVLGRFQPDLSGWHNSVAVKLRKMRYETSTVISDIVQNYNISYGTRLCIELIPSLFLYSKMKSSCKKKYAKNDLADNLSNIDV